MIKQGIEHLPTWSTSNASTVAIASAGHRNSLAVILRRSRACPKQTAEGPVDESTTYTLNASTFRRLGNRNRSHPHHRLDRTDPGSGACQRVLPNRLPDKKNVEAGLLKSQQDALTTAATGFKKYLEYDPDAKLSIAAHADVRGSKKFNQELTERRSLCIKEFLVVQGVPADKVETAAYGKDQEMDKKDIKELEN